MSLLGALQLILLAGFAFAVLTGCLASGSAPLLLSRTSSWSPERRHRALLLLSVTPMLFAAFAVLSVLSPSVLALLWPDYDHCLRHNDHHVHLCLVHLPRQLGNAASWWVLLVVLGWTVSRGARALAQLYRASQCASQLRRHAQADPVLSASVLPTSVPLCVLAGVLRPTLFLSRGLLAGASAEEIAVILHHERAHAARRDILVRLVARAGTLFMWPSARAKILRALELAAEQSCDEVAAAKIGDRLQVAAAILKVERLLQMATRQLTPLAVTFGGDTVPQRVSALLEAPKRSGNVFVLSMAFVSMLCGVLAASEPLHHLTESLLEALVH